MGKIKSSKKPQAKKGPQPLDKVFRCLFCQHPGTVTCKLDKQIKLGSLECKNCGQSFKASIHGLTQPVDLYSDWIDAAEEANESAEPPQSLGSTHKRRRPAEEDDDDAVGESDDGLDHRAAQRRRAQAPSNHYDDDDDGVLPDTV